MVRGAVHSSWEKQPGEREGHGAVAWMGNTKTAALDQGSRVR